MTHTITTNFLARTSGLDATHINAYTAFIDGLVDQGICTDTTWGPFDLLYIFATANATHALLNLPSATYNGVNVNGVVFTADRGYDTSGVNSVGISTGFIPSTASSPQYARNSAMMGAYIRNNRLSGASSSDAGVYDGTNDTELTCWYVDNNQYLPVNGTGAGDGAASVVAGNWIQLRTGASSTVVYRNGTSFVTGSEASKPVPTKEVYFCTINSNGTLGSNQTGDQLAAGFLGAALTAQQAAIFDNLLNTFMAAVGANVYAVTGPIFFDAAGNSGDVAAASSYSGSASWNGTNRMLAADVSMLGPGVTVTAMTYGGANCTFIGAQSTVTSFGRVESWRICSADSGAPAAGSNTLAVTLSGSLEFSVEWASYIGVHQTVPTEAFNSAQATNAGSATNASVSVTTVADCDWVHAAVVANDTSITAGNTTRNNISGTLGSGANEDNGAAKTPAGAVSMFYSGMGIATTWAIGGYGIRPVSAPSSGGNVVSGGSTEGADATAGAVKVAIKASGGVTEGADASAGNVVTIIGFHVSGGITEGADASAGNIKVAVKVSGGVTEGPDSTAGQVIASTRTISGGFIEGADATSGAIRGVAQGGHFLPLTKKEIAAARKRAKKAREVEQAIWDQAAKERAELHKQIMETLHPEKILGVGKGPEAVEEDDDEADIEMLLLYG